MKPKYFLPIKLRLKARYASGLIGFSLLLAATFTAYGQLKVNGRTLYDECGKPIILRGIENVLYYDTLRWANDPYGKYIDDIAATGANAIRILGGGETQFGGAPNLDDILDRCINKHKMWVSIAQVDWRNPEIRAVIKKYESFVSLHAQGEINHSDDQKWVNDSKAVIDRFRGWGFKCPIELMANQYGQNADVVLQRGNEVFDHDPEGNIIFGTQIYSKYGDDPRSKLDEIAAFGHVIQVGVSLFTIGIGASWSSHTGNTYKRVWEYAWEKGLSTMYWDFYGGNGDNISCDGTLNCLTDVGQFLLNNSQYTIGGTAEKSAFLLNKSCDGVVPPTPEPIAQTPYQNGGSPRGLADGKTIQAEDYDNGGQGVAYNDKTPNNNLGGKYRTNGVDIGTTPDGSTTYVGWIEAGEWLEYSIDATAGTYDISVSMASPNDNRTLRLKLGDQTLGTLDCPNSSQGFTDFKAATLSGVSIPAGKQVLRLEMVDGAFNINSLRFVRTDASSSGQIVVRAKGDCGVEKMELRVGGQKVKDWTVTTSYANYTYNGFADGGRVSVHFVNDNSQVPGCGDSNLEVDYIQVCGATYQTETQAVKTSTCCPNNKSKLYTNGDFNFGQLSCAAPASGTVVIRAKGAGGSERMGLLVNGQEVRRWTVSAQAANYFYQGYSGGAISVIFDNDADGRDLAINYIDVCGTRYEAENATRSLNCGDTNGGFIWLWCNSTLNFGNVGCGSSARSAQRVAKEVKPLPADAWAKQFSTYPNPATEQLTVEGSEDYQVDLYDISGRHVMQREHLKGKASLDISRLHPGVYVVKMSDGLLPELRQRIIVE